MVRFTHHDIEKQRYSLDLHGNQRSRSRASVKYSESIRELR
jgi:hypothetical protein